MLILFRALRKTAASAKSVGSTSEAQADKALKLGSDALKGTVSSFSAHSKVPLKSTVVATWLSATPASIRGRREVADLRSRDTAVFERHTQVSLFSSRSVISYKPAGTLKRFTIETREVGLAPGVSVVTRDVRRGQSFFGDDGDYWFIGSRRGGRRELRIGSKSLPLPYSQR